MKGLWKSKKYQQKLNGNVEVKTSRAKNADKKFSFPPEAELERITKYFADPNCKEINIGLMPNASELDKAKYDICQSISRYKRINKLTPNELAKKLKISQEKTDDILFGRIGKWLSNSPRFVQWQERITGTMLIALGIKVALSSKK